MYRMFAMAAVLVLVGCGDPPETAPSGAPGAVPVRPVAFVATQDGAPFTVPLAWFDTPEAREFAATGKNPYIGREEAEVHGRKLFQLYSCTQCHGAEAQGQTGPGLQGPDFKHPKNATNQGMFETIWHGTNGGMGAKGRGLMDPSDPNNGLTPDEVLKIIAWIRTHGTLTGNAQD